MILKRFIFFASFLIFCNGILKAQHEIIFCDEKIPVSNNFVSGTLMNAIRKQIPNVNLPELRRRAVKNFPLVEYYLHETGLPDDLKYIAIVESGFQNLTSRAGARGFWQIMPDVARAHGLVVTDNVDERDNIYKATYVACKELAASYLMIRKKYGISSWILTAAAYNTGIGNMFKNIDRQGTDYFSMDLNAETAAYVYKIIAVKELFEYPELYMKDFGYNVFRNNNAVANNMNNDADTSVFNSMVVNVNTGDGEHPDTISTKEPVIENPAYITSKPSVNKNIKVSYIAANIKGKYKNFNDGELISIQLQDNLMVNGIFNKKGNVIKGTGWIIDDRIMVDLGYAGHSLTLINNGKKGIAFNELKNDQPVLLRVQEGAN